MWTLLEAIHECEKLWDNAPLHFTMGLQMFQFAFAGTCHKTSADRSII
jgi:hypothetical protein